MSGRLADHSGFDRDGDSTYWVVHLRRAAASGSFSARHAKRLRMGPAVVLGQDLAEAAGAVGTVWWQIWQRVTGR
jgi:hypothetical protein